MVVRGSGIRQSFDSMPYLNLCEIVVVEVYLVLNKLPPRLNRLKVQLELLICLIYQLALIQFFLELFHVKMGFGVICENMFIEDLQVIKEYLSIVVITHEFWSIIIFHFLYTFLVYNLSSLQSLRRFPRDPFELSIFLNCIIFHILFFRQIYRLFIKILLFRKHAFFIIRLPFLGHHLLSFDGIEPENLWVRELIELEWPLFELLLGEHLLRLLAHAQDEPLYQVVPERVDLIVDQIEGSYDRSGNVIDYDVPLEVVFLSVEFFIITLVIQMQFMGVCILQDLLTIWKLNYTQDKVYTDG